jgi:hypothetical protein
MRRAKIVGHLGELCLLAVWLALIACHVQEPASSTPAIVFSKIPVADQTSPNKSDIIEGRATGVRRGQRILLYVKRDGRWGLQRASDQVFTNLDRNGGWAGSTLLGIQYAALLVDPAYNPPEQIESLPNVGAAVASVAVVDGGGTVPVLPPAKSVSFSGYDWITSSGPNFHAGSRNFFDPANVTTDKSGALHLRISGTPGKWTAAEIKLNRTLGYGTYRFKVRDASHLEPSAVLTLITWDGMGTERNRSELDVELSRWGYANNDNAHYVVQPYYIPANIVRFRVPAGACTHSFRWEPGQVTFSTMAGPDNAARVIDRHVFTSGIPSADGQSVRIALYVFSHGEIPLKNENEVVIEKFEFLP